MTKHAYISWKPTHSTRVILDRVFEVVSKYEAAGYQMTLRQLYYQLVSQNVIENTEKQYQKLSRILTNAREAGMVDWDFIVDRNREYRRRGEFTGIPDLIAAAKDSFRLPRWENQPNYVEVVTEKDALSGVFLPICDKYHIGLLVDRGYGSATAIHDMSDRFKAARQKGKTCYLLYLGDHDPSGMDMPEDIAKRFQRYGTPTQIVRLGLTFNQAQEHHLPANKVKNSDKRAKKYKSIFGEDSWELDALPPNVLIDSLEGAIRERMNLDLYNSVIQKEEKEKARLLGIATAW